MPKHSVSTELTADQHSMGGRDTDISGQIRRELMKQDNVSTYGQNIKIITINGKVTLKGAVRDLNEKNVVLTHARNLADVINVTDEIWILGTNKWRGQMVSGTLSRGIFPQSREILCVVRSKCR
jgi:osmotically-inducible protein OsmY